MHDFVPRWAKRLACGTRCADNFSVVARAWAGRAPKLLLVFLCGQCILLIVLELGTYVDWTQRLDRPRFHRFHRFHRFYVCCRCFERSTESSCLGRVLVLTAALVLGDDRGGCGRARQAKNDEQARHGSHESFHGESLGEGSRGGECGKQDLRLPFETRRDHKTSLGYQEAGVLGRD